MVTPLPLDKSLPVHAAPTFSAFAVLGRRVQELYYQQANPQ